MPTYQYTCTECGEGLEAVQKFTDDPLTECPACHGRLRKVFSPVGVVFKGSGFYRNDSRNASSSKVPASSNGSKKESNGSSSSSDSSDSTSTSTSSSGSKESSSTSSTSTSTKTESAA